MRTGVFVVIAVWKDNCAWGTQLVAAFAELLGEGGLRDTCRQRVRPRARRQRPEGPSDEPCASP
jgi:hypothetical protein